MSDRRCQPVCAAVLHPIVPPVIHMPSARSVRAKQPRNTAGSLHPIQSTPRQLRTTRRRERSVAPVNLHEKDPSARAPIQIPPYSVVKRRQSSMKWIEGDDKARARFHLYHRQRVGPRLTTKEPTSGVQSEASSCRQDRQRMVDFTIYGFR